MADPSVFQLRINGGDQVTFTTAELDNFITDAQQHVKEHLMAKAEDAGISIHWELIEPFLAESAKQMREHFRRLPIGKTKLIEYGYLPDGSMVFSPSFIK